MISVKMNCKEFAAYLHLLHDIATRYRKRSDGKNTIMFDQTAKTTQEQWKLLSALFENEIGEGRITVHLTSYQAIMLRAQIVDRYDELEESGFVHIVLSDFDLCQFRKMFDSEFEGNFSVS